MNEKLNMDFVNWCTFLINTCIKTHRTLTFEEHSLRKLLFTELGITQVSTHPGFHFSTYEIGMFNAMKELKTVGLIDQFEQSSILSKISKAGREYVADTTPLWWNICLEKLEPEHEKLLCAVNRLSQHKAPDHAWLEMVDSQSIVSEMGVQSFADVWSIARELEQWGFVSGYFTTDINASLQSTFKGLVWDTRRGFTLESKFIDDLVAEWETASVEFKQYLYIKSVEQKAEFIKDILGLANTKTSGRRWMIIGFSNKTRNYSNPPNTDLNQDDLERLIGEYTHPYVDVVYKVVEHRKGLVGKLEIVRDPQKLPYRVAKSLGDKLKGDKKQIFKGQIFVRHGTQVVVARGTERKELLEEGKRTRSNTQI